LATTAFSGSGATENFLGRFLPMKPTLVQRPAEHSPESQGAANVNRWGDHCETAGGTAAAPRIRKNRRSLSRWALACLVMLAVGWGFGRWTKRGVATTALPEIGRFLPAEFEPCEAILLGWPCGYQSEEAKFAHRALLAEICNAVEDRTKIIVLAPDEPNIEAARQQLRAAERSQLQVRQAPVTSIWIRDFGPLVVETADGGLEALDCNYFDPRFPAHDHVPASFSRLMSIPHWQVPLTMEFGNVLTNGAGLFVTTELMLEGNELDEEQLAPIFREHFGASEVVVLERLVDEETGHVDMFATFTAPDTIVIGQYDSVYDELNAAVLDRNAEKLRGVRTALGPLKVHRIPMPGRAGGCWRTYTNVVFVNGVLLLPSYGPKYKLPEQQAIELYSRLLPTWQIKLIDCARVIQDRGALHCSTMNITRLPQVADPPLTASEVSEPLDSAW
jgi:agmatine/peptidylarginine deiminase